MAITQADRTTIQTVFGKTAEEISGALSSTEEVSLGLKLNGKVFTHEQEMALKEGGVQQGKEIGLKSVAKNLKVTLDAGEKDPIVIARKLTEAVTATMEAKYKNRAPSEELVAEKQKNKDWEAKFNTLDGTYKLEQEKSSEWKEKHGTLLKTNTQNEIDSEIRKYLASPEKTGLSYAQQLALFKMDITAEKVEGKVHLKKATDGTPVLSTAGKDESVENAVPAWLEEQPFMKKAGKGGGDDEGDKKGGGKTPEQAQKIIEDQGIAPASSEGLKMFNELTAAKKE
jgi:hypothetical protein